MKAYLNKPELKERFLKEIKAHEKADSFLQGAYAKDGEKFRGCAVGCSLKSLNRINEKDGDYDEHKRYEEELGIPESVAWLEDEVFEGLPVEEARKWPYKFSKAIRVGADLSMIDTKFKLWLLRKNGDVYKNAFNDGKKAIDMVVEVLEAYLKTGEWEHFTASAAYSAAYSAAASAADSAAYKKQAKYLLKLLKEAPIN